MSDRPRRTTQDNPEEMNGESGWHAPEQPGGWREPEPSPRDDAGGWRVPALPADLDIVPDNKGAWHLPNPGDTSFQPDDELEVSDAGRGDNETVATAQARESETLVALPFDNVQTSPAKP